MKDWHEAIIMVLAGVGVSQLAGSSEAWPTAVMFVFLGKMLVASINGIRELS